MKMDNIEFVWTTTDLIEHDQGAGRMVANPATATLGVRSAPDWLRF